MKTSFEKFCLFVFGDVSSSLCISLILLLVLSVFFFSFKVCSCYKFCGTWFLDL